MSEHFPALIIVFPLLAAFIIAGAGWFRKEICFPLALISLAAALFVSIGLL